MSKSNFGNRISKECIFLSFSYSEEDSLVAMLRFQEFERSTVDTEGAMGLAAILAGQLPELKGKKWVKCINFTVSYLNHVISLHSSTF